MYYLLLALLYPLSLLPLRILYLLGDAAYGLLYHIMGYRKQIVWDNLKNSFPEKSNEEIQLIRKKFYRSFCDQWIETLKLLSISKKELSRRFTGNWEVFHELEKTEGNIALLSGHTYNWEWANAACALNTSLLY